MVLAAFTVLDVAILLSIGHSRHAPQLLDRIVAKTSTASPGTDTAPTVKAAAPEAAAAAPRSGGTRTATPSSAQESVQQADVEMQRSSASAPGHAARQTAGKKRAVAQPAPRTTHAKSPHRKKPAAPRRPAAKPKKAQRRTAARHPSPISRSHYLRSLNGGARDARRMYQLGRYDAAAHGGNAARLVLLDIGGQTLHGVRLSTTTTHLTYAQLVHAVRSYVAGYHTLQGRGAPVTIAVGTNNDLATDAVAGRLWAQGVIDPLRVAARGYQGITIAGAIDVEPGFRVGPAGSQAWVEGYLRSTSAPLIFNGSADGCSWTRTFSACAAGWTAHQLSVLAGGRSSRITVLPQVYNSHMAAQWALISLTSVRAGGRPLRFWGPLTENRACAGQSGCPTMPSLTAWQYLWNDLRRYHVAGPRPPLIIADLDVS